MTCISNTNSISPWLVFHVTSKVGVWSFCHFTELNLNVKVHIQIDIQNWFALPKWLCVFILAAAIFNNRVAFPHSVWIPAHLHYKVSCVCVGYLCAYMAALSPLYCRELLCITLSNSLIPYLFCYWHNLCRRPENRYASIMPVLLF